MSRPKKPKCNVLIDYVVREEAVPGIIQYMIETKGEGTITTRSVEIKPEIKETGEQNEQVTEH